MGKRGGKFGAQKSLESAYANKDGILRQQKRNFLLTIKIARSEGMRGGAESPNFGAKPNLTAQGMHKAWDP